MKFRAKSFNIPFWHFIILISVLLSSLCVHASADKNLAQKIREAATQAINAGLKSDYQTALTRLLESPDPDGPINTLIHRTPSGVQATVFDILEMNDVLEIFWIQVQRVNRYDLHNLSLIKYLPAQMENEIANCTQLGLLATRRIENREEWTTAAQTLVKAIQIFWQIADDSSLHPKLNRTIRKATRAADKKWTTQLDELAWDLGISSSSRKWLQFKSACQNLLRSFGKSQGS